MFQGGDAVSKTACGGFNSQLSVPFRQAGEEAREAKYQGKRLMAGEKTQRSREQYAARTKQPKNQGRKVAPSMRQQMKTLDRFRPKGTLLGRMPHTEM